MNRIWAKIPLLLFYLLLGALGPVAAQPLEFDGIWRYLEQGGDIPNQSATEQVYRLSLMKDLSASSHFSGDVRYNRIDESEDGYSTLLSPTGTLDMRNDLFVFSLSGQVTRIENELDPDLETRSWNANWFTALPDWPTLRLNYGQTFLDRENEDGVVSSNTTSYGANLLHNFRLFRVQYDYRHSESERESDQTENIMDRHLGQVLYSQPLFGGKMNLNISEQVIYTRFEDFFFGTDGGFQFRPILPLQGLAAADETPDFGALEPEAALVDGGLVAGVAEILQSTVPWNIGLETRSEPVEQIRLVLDREIDEFTQAQLQWEVYASSDNLNWVPVTPIMVSFEDEVIPSGVITEVEIDLPSSVSSQYIKVVVENPGAPAFPDVAFVTEILAGTLVEAPPVSQGRVTDTLDLKSTLGLSYRISPEWSVAYNFNHLRRQDQSDEESTLMTHAVRTNYYLNQYLSLIAGVTENRDVREGNPDRMSRIYSGSVNSKLLPTLDLALGYTHLNTYEEGEHLQQTNTAYGNLIALIYPDLSSSLTGTWSRSENLENDSDTTTYFLNYDVTARVSPRLHLDFNTSYSHSEQRSPDRSSTTDRVTYGARSSYRPSGLLLLQVDVSRDEEDDQTILLGSFFWRLTPRIQNNGSVLLNFGDQAFQTYEYRINWILGPRIFIDAGYIYRNTEEVDSWNVASSLNVSL